MNSIGQHGPDSGNVIGHRSSTETSQLKHIVRTPESELQIGARSLMLADLLLLLAITAIATVATLSSIELPAAVQAVSGILASLFIPGYAATCVLFPRTSSLDGLSRIALSCALSFATISLAALVLESTAAQVTGRTLVGTLAAATAIYTVLAIARRVATPANDRYVPRFPDGGIRQRKALPTPGRRVLLIAGVAGLLFTGSALTLLSSYAEDEPSTEFALLNSSGEPEFYDRHYRAGETISLMLEVTNLEGQQQRYVVSIKAQGESIGEPLVLDLDSGDRWRDVVQLELPPSDGMFPVTFELYRDAVDAAEEPYRSVRLMVSPS